MSSKFETGNSVEIWAYIYHEVVTEMFELKSEWIEYCPPGGDKISDEKKID